MDCCQGTKKNTGIINKNPVAAVFKVPIILPKNHVKGGISYPLTRWKKYKYTTTLKVAIATATI
ncbi:hypothetical protein PbJCM13498_03980 [Prolixibacter bellariivorans]|uniref:Uncharacterized protein n=1 Tax=Prolixibacter bellariivorans TaxID=314319 RepID=A0A5M4AUC3_9BACT|nr:hypothetical protein PbJCM13498_03980 [Prolixibacter bellariivorans]